MTTIIAIAIPIGNLGRIRAADRYFVDRQGNVSE